MAVSNTVHDLIKLICSREKFSRWSDRPRHKNDRKAAALTMVIVLSSPWDTSTSFPGTLRYWFDCCLDRYGCLFLRHKKYVYFKASTAEARLTRSESFRFSPARCLFSPRTFNTIRGVPPPSGKNGNTLSKLFYLFMGISNMGFLYQSSYYFLSVRNTHCSEYFFSTRIKACFRKTLHIITDWLLA